MQTISRRTLLAGAALAPLAPTFIAVETAHAAPAIRQVTVDANSPASKIRALQFLLSSYGYVTTPSGTFDAQTTQSVKKFQAARGISTTGYAGPQTMGSMISGANVAVGVGWINANTVKAVEQLLGNAGLSVPIDGSFTSADLDKLNNFQRARSLPPTRAVDHLTWSWLFEPDVSTNIRRGSIVHVPQYSNLPSWEHDCGPASLVMLQLRLGMTPGRWTNVENRAAAIQYARRNVIGVTHNLGLGDINHVEPILNPMRSVLHLNARGVTTAGACAAVKAGGVAMIAGSLDVANSWQGRTSSNGIHHWVTILDYRASSNTYGIEDPARVQNRLVWVSQDGLAKYCAAAGGNASSTTAIAVS